MARGPHLEVSGTRRRSTSMKRSVLFLLTLVLALPAFADKGRDQSFFTYDDGGTILKQGDDGGLVSDGWVEVRTPQRTLRIRSGEEARVDDQGLYGLVSLPRGSGDDFERWFTHRAERYDKAGRYVDSSIAYSESDLADYG